MRSRVAQVHTPLGRKYLIEDIEGGRKYPTLAPTVRAELLAVLRRGEVAA